MLHLLPSNPHTAITPIPLMYKLQFHEHRPFWEKSKWVLFLGKSGRDEYLNCLLFGTLYSFIMCISFVFMKCFLN